MKFDLIGDKWMITYCDMREPWATKRFIKYCAISDEVYYCNACQVKANYTHAPISENYIYIKSGTFLPLFNESQI